MLNKHVKCAAKMLLSPLVISYLVMVLALGVILFLFSVLICLLEYFSGCDLPDYMSAYCNNATKPAEWFKQL